MIMGHGFLRKQKAVNLLAAALYLFSFACCLQIEATENLTPVFVKSIPEGFGQQLQPNVLLLLDTSGSMTYRLTSESETYGDGSRPVTYGGITARYFGWDVDEDNNDPDNLDDYHPNLKYISDEDLSGVPEWYLDDYFANGAGGYLYPNDSRLYKLKLVLWRILNDTSLVSGLRVALSTFYQRENWDDYGTNSNFYKYVAYSHGYYMALQYINWDYDDWRGDKYNYARMREDFGSTDDSDHLASLKEWIDGAEVVGSQMEIRAHGHTPLAASIYNTYVSYDSGTGRGSALQFFTKTNPTRTINGWCQQNWLVVLADGADSGPSWNNDPVQSVYNLYHESIGGTSGDPFFGETARPIRTFVIGLVDPDTQESYGDTLNDMADVGWDGENNGDGQAYFANDVPTLLQAFRDIFRIIQVESGAGGAPMVSVARDSGTDDSVYITAFAPKIDQQWYGRLSQYTINDGEMEETADWDAGEVLNATEWSDRTVYTVEWGDSASSAHTISGSNIVLYNTANSGYLEYPMLSGIDNPQDIDLEKFIRWSLGSDEWDEDPNSTERWKLGDIYHGGLTKVDPPHGGNPQEAYRDFIYDNRNRETLLYVQANDGMLHAVDPDDGSERWAFIPPNVLAAGKMVGMKGTFTESGGSWTINYYDSTTSEPCYLLDGPLVAEDIWTGSKWKTYLIGLQGYAGPGMYVLDITNPDKPKFKWAIENSIYEPDGSGLVDEDNREVSRWRINDKTGKRESKPYTNSSFAYDELRFTVSVPVIGLFREAISDDPVSVAVMGNGSPRSISEDTSTSGAVYVVDIVNGKLITKFTPSGMGHVAAPITAMSDSFAQTIDYIYAAGQNGGVFEWTLTSGWASRQVFDFESTVGPSYKMEVAKVRADPWLFFATGDYDGLVETGENTNYVISLNTTFSGATPLALSDLTEISAGDGSVSSSTQGWYFALSDNELPTTPVKLYNGYLLFATFASSEDPCKTGTSRLYLVEALTGASGWNCGDKYIEIQGTKISGITVSDDKVYVGVTRYGGSSIPDELTQLNAVSVNQMMVFDLPGAVANIILQIPSGQIKPQYWREWRP